METLAFFRLLSHLLVKLLFLVAGNLELFHKLGHLDFILLPLYLEILDLLLESLHVVVALELQTVLLLLEARNLCLQLSELTLVQRQLPLQATHLVFLQLEVLN